MKRPRTGEPKVEPLEWHGSRWVPGGWGIIGTTEGCGAIGTTEAPDGLGGEEGEERRDAEEAQGSLPWSAHGSVGAARLRGTGSGSGKPSVSRAWVRDNSMVERASMGSPIWYRSRKCEKASQ